MNLKLTRFIRLLAYYAQQGYSIPTSINYAWRMAK